jgi:choline dehydrogenase-like flavoprotein
MGEKSDLLGRPLGTQNIHVVDSSVLPTIAPGPITFTAMANAMRIAEAAVK